MEKLRFAKDPRRRKEKHREKVDTLRGKRIPDATQPGAECTRAHLDRGPGRGSWRKRGKLCSGSVWYRPPRSTRERQGATGATGQVTRPELSTPRTRPYNVASSRPPHDVARSRRMNGRRRGVFCGILEFHETTHITSRLHVLNDDSEFRRNSAEFLGIPEFLENFSQLGGIPRKS